MFGQPRGPHSFPYTTLFRSRARDRLRSTGPTAIRPRSCWSRSFDPDPDPVAEQLRPGVVAEHEIGRSTRLNSSHLGISYAVFCLKKKNQLSDVIEQSMPVRL